MLKILRQQAECMHVLWHFRRFLKETLKFDVNEMFQSLGNDPLSKVRSVSEDEYLRLVNSEIVILFLQVFLLLYSSEAGI